MSTRTIDGLLSGVSYTIYVTYTYDIGDGEVSQTYSKSKYTSALRAPTVELSYDPTSETSLSFELDIKDPSEILEINSIKLIPEDGEEIELSDLTARAFEDIPSGKYQLVVEYQYDLNKGQGVVVDEAILAVSTKISPLAIPDFIVEVEEGRNPVVLQISDPQIIDAMQARPGDSGVSSYYNPDKMEDRLFGYLRETIASTQPDLILVTGDLVYGKYDDNGTSLLALIKIMDSFEIPWAPVFGNHDNESKMGVDWQCQQLENAEHCLFKQRSLSGNGNYTVGIAQGGELIRVFFMMDTNGCGEASAESLANGHTFNNFVGFKDDQINWFMEVGNQINELSPNTKISFAFHIQISQFKNAYAKYGYTNYGTKEKPISIDWHPDKAEGDFGYLGADLKGPWDGNNVVYNKMLSIGTDSIYVGHEHNNNASVVYNGVRFQFSQKISTYDRCNWLLKDGSILSSYPEPAHAQPLMGGTVNVLGEDGSIIDAYIYYCNDLDPTIPPQEPLEVSGIQYGSDLFVDTSLAYGTKEVDGHNAYEITAVSQGKFYVKSALVANKSTFSFTVYLPSSSNNKLGGYGEFAIRVKANTLEPNVDGTIDGYIDFDSTSVIEDLKLVYDEWVTYTIDISSLGANCTEWAFVIAKGNVVYFRDIVIE